MLRKGMGKGKGSGWKNMRSDDSHRHSLSARGIKNAQKINPSYMRSKYGLETDSGSEWARLRNEGLSDAEAQAQAFSTKRARELEKFSTDEIINDLKNPDPKLTDYYLLLAREELELRNPDLELIDMTIIAKNTGMYSKTFGAFNRDEYKRVENVNSKTNMVMVYPNTFVSSTGAKRLIDAGVKKGQVVVRQVRPKKDGILLSVQYKAIKKVKSK
jgi:hypothetical protein